MPILPSELIQWLEDFRPLLRVEVFATFALLLTGLLVGEVKQVIVRASVFARALVWGRLKELAAKTGRTVYQLKQGLLDGYFIQ